MAIQHRRGSFSDFDASKMLPGEFAFSTDTSEVYYCFSPGNVKRVASREELIEFIETTEEAYIVMQELKGVVAEGKTVDEALSIVINNANTTKGDLDDSINLGNILKDWLDLNIATGTTLNNNLITNVAKGEGLETSLPPLITSANTTKTALDESITEGTVLKDDLNTIITGTDYELLITDVASLKTNKADKTYVDSEIVRVEGKVDNIIIPDPTWGNLQNKPIEFPPSQHNHPISNVDNLQIELDKKANDDEVKTHLAESTQQAHLPKNVGLANVDNLKQMPISGGVLENYREKLVTVGSGSGIIYLSLGNVFQHTPNGDRTYSISNAVNDQAHSFTLIINMDSTVRTLTFPASVKWQGGDIPDMSTANKTYVLTFMTVDGGTTWLGMFGGEF